MAARHVCLFAVLAVVTYILADRYAVSDIIPFTIRLTQLGAPNMGARQDVGISTAPAATTTSRPEGALFTNAPRQVEPPETTYVVAASDTSARLASLFQVCGLCPGGKKIRRFGPGGYAICEELLDSSLVRLAGADAWNKLGANLTVLRPDVKIQVMTCEPASVVPPKEVQHGEVLHATRSCTIEQAWSPYPVVLGKVQVFNNIGVANLGQFVWKHLLDTPEAWTHYRMLILELPWLEEQTNHLLYLQAMEMLLKEFLLVHVDVSTCHGRWQIRSTEVGMPRVVQATFVRKDLAVAQTCTTQLLTDSGIWDCPGIPRTLPAPFGLLGAPGLGEPLGLFHVYGSPIAVHARSTVVNRKITLDLLKRFRLCHTCPEGDGDFVRVGGGRDGGYLLCGSAARNLTLAISIGIRGLDPFGAALSEEFGPRVEGFDCTGNPYACPPSYSRCRFHFNPLCVGKPFDGMPASQFLMLPEILDLYAKPSDEMLLKIDCEGCEWSVLPQIEPRVLRRFRMIIMEAHWLEKQDKHPVYAKAMDVILEHFDLVHSHACNRYDVLLVNGTDFQLPRVLEVTFLRKDLTASASCRNSKYRDGLDKPIANVRELDATAFRLPPADSETDVR
ncbi:unnamed protein product [Symbiodinium sp. CCMP2592]|nr:unnamed protein product [Symbiodinium sp. CCMP2592]